MQGNPLENVGIVLEIILKEGKYYFTAELNEGSPTATTTHFYVYEKPNLANVNNIYVYGLSEEENLAEAYGEIIPEQSSIDDDFYEELEEILII